MHTASEVNHHVGLQQHQGHKRHRENDVNVTYECCVVKANYTDYITRKGCTHEHKDIPLPDQGRINKTLHTTMTTHTEGWDKCKVYLSIRSCTQSSTFPRRKSDKKATLFLPFSLADAESFSSPSASPRAV